MENEEKLSLITNSENSILPTEIRLPYVKSVNVTNDSVKHYKVTVRYLNVTEEEAEIKKAIIESIMRKSRSDHKLE